MKLIIFIFQIAVASVPNVFADTLSEDQKDICHTEKFETYFNDDKKRTDTATAIAGFIDLAPFHSESPQRFQQLTAAPQDDIQKLTDSRHPVLCQSRTLSQPELNQLKNQTIERAGDYYKYFFPQGSSIKQSAPIAERLAAPLDTFKTPEEFKTILNKKYAFLKDEIGLSEKFDQTCPLPQVSDGASNQLKGKEFIVSKARYLAHEFRKMKRNSVLRILYSLDLQLKIIESHEQISESDLLTINDLEHRIKNAGIFVRQGEVDATYHQRLIHQVDATKRLIIKKQISCLTKQQMDSLPKETKDLEKKGLKNGLAK